MIAKPILSTTAVAVALAVAGASAGCHRDTAPAPDARPEAARSRVRVRVRPVVTRPEPRGIEVSGVVEAIERVAIASEVPGRVVRVVAREGSGVAAGEVLVELDRERFAARRDVARADLAYARAQAVSARAHRQRIERLFERGSASRQALDDARAADAKSAAAVDRARAALEGAELELERTRIRAPRAGVVVDKSVAAGDTALPGRTLMVLEDRSRVEIVAAVPVEFAAGLGPGVEARLLPDGERRRAFTAPITRIVLSADPTARTVSVRFAVDDSRLRLVPGGFVRCLLPAGSDDVIRLPLRAVTRRGSIAFVHVVDADRRADRRLVEVGRQVDDEIEILSGVVPGELVVVASDGPLSDGAPVKVDE